MWEAPVFVAYLVLALTIPLVRALAPVWRRARIARQVRCPQAAGSASIDLDAWYAVKMHALGNSELCVRHCSRWPEDRDCGRECLIQIAAV